MDVFEILKPGEKVTPKEYSPLALAFMGDAVFESFVRLKVLCEANASANTLHKRAVSYVNCKSQADAAFAFIEMLTDEELAVFKRGRNAKTFTVPKNAQMSDYHTATGFEALIGWLYLSGRNERAVELMEFSYEFIKKQHSKEA